MHSNSNEEPKSQSKDIVPMLKGWDYEPGTINVRKVLWACAELALPFEREDWAGPFRPTSDPAFLSLNPVGLYPEARFIISGPVAPSWPVSFMPSGSKIVALRKSP